MALSVARQVRDGTPCRVTPFPARRLAQHRDILGTPAGFFADNAPDDGHQLRHQHDAPAAEYFRSATGARHDPESRQLCAAVWPCIDEYRWKQNAISRQTGRLTGISALQHQYTDNSHRELA